MLVNVSNTGISESKLNLKNRTAIFCFSFFIVLVLYFVDHIAILVFDVG